MATTKVTANVLADNSITQAKLADDAIGAAELASNAVVNASIASGAAIDMDKLDGDSLASAITDFAQDDLVILSDTSASGNLVKITTSNFEDAIFGNISGDVTLAAGGAATAAAAQTNITSVLNASLALGRDADNQIKFATDNQIIFEVSGGDNVIFKASGEIVATSLDISGGVDVDGTLEADAITINGTTLAETISDTVGAMVGSNTETGIAVSYDDSDNTLDFVIGAGVIVNSMLADDAVGADELAADAVVTASIANSQVTVAKMAANSIDSDQYVDGSIDNAHLADDAVNSDEIAAGAIDLAHMSANSIDSDQYVNASIDLAHMSVNSIDSDQYVDGSIDAAHLAADIITGAKIADDAIDSEHYVDASIDNAHIADDAIDSEHYAAGSIDTAHIADNQITHDKLELRYTELSALGTGGSKNLDFSAATTFTATMNADSTFTVVAPKQGQVVDLILAGDHAPTLAMSGATFNKVGTVAYDGSTTNLIQILVADDASSEIFYYSVAPIASDTTP